MKTILVLTDFSTKANSAAKFAMQLAIKIEANILLCHAMESVLPLPKGKEFNVLPSVQKLHDKYVANLVEIGNDLKKDIPENTFNPTLEYKAVPGSLSEATLEIISNNSINLIISGAHKTGGLLSFLSKSHSHSIMDSIDCPTLFIPEGVEFKEINTISYATDFSFNNGKVLPFLANLANPFNASIEVNHITAGDFSSVLPKQSVEHSLKLLLKENKPKVSYNCIQSDDVRTTLHNLTLSGKTDILVLVHKKYDFIDGLLHQSISKELAGTAAVPLLVLPHTYSKNTADISSEELEQFCFNAGELR